MKKLLILAALAGFGVMACGDDGDDKGTENGNGGKTDAGPGKGDAGLVIRPVQVTNVGAACTTKADCQGPAGLCETELGMDDMTVELKGGYCTAQCNATAECGATGGCPVAEITASLPPAALELAASFGLSLDAILPSNCYQKCTVGGTTCRDGYECKTIAEILPAALTSNQLAAGLVGGAAFKVPYCLPPIELEGDAGVRDGGAAVVVGGIDAGL